MPEREPRVPQWYGLILIGICLYLSWPLWGYWNLDPKGVGGRWLFAVWASAIVFLRWRSPEWTMRPAWATAATVVALLAILLDVAALSGMALALSGTALFPSAAGRWAALVLGVAWNSVFTRFWLFDDGSGIFPVRVAIAVGAMYGMFSSSWLNEKGKSKVVAP